MNASESITSAHPHGEAVPIRANAASSASSLHQGFAYKRHAPGVGRTIANLQPHLRAAAALMAAALAQYSLGSSGRSSTITTETGHVVGSGGPSKRGGSRRSGSSSRVLLCGAVAQPPVAAEAHQLVYWRVIARGAWA